MPDRRRLVTLDAVGVATIVKDFEDATNYYAVQTSFQVKPGAVKPVMAERQRRFGGSTAVAETQDNGTVAWQAFVKGATADAALARAEEIFQTLRQPRRDLYFEWRAVSATGSTFYEVRGPANLTPTYESRQFGDSKSWKVDVEIPVGPLAVAEPITITIASSTFPNVVALATTIPGSAPALANVTLRTNGGVAAPIWAMLGWTKRPGSPLASSVAPFGIIEAESGANLTGWAVTANASFRGGSLLYTGTISAAGTASATWALDPSVMQTDDYAAGEVDIEVWARVETNAGLVSPKVVLSLQPFAGLSFGGEQFSAEYGAVGKLLSKPSSANAQRFVKAGTLTMPVDPAAPLKWNLKTSFSWAAGSGGALGMDYLVLVPSRQRALSPTAKPNDSAYPKFIASTSDTQKRIYGADLSGAVASAAGNFGRDSGLGGSPIELPVGNVDLLVKLSSLVPDDPTSDTTFEQVSHTSVTGSVVVWPRYWLSKGA